MSLRRSTLLGSGHAPPRAIDGGAALRLPAAAVCWSKLRGGHGREVASCSLAPSAHADGWHKGGGWRWHDDGRAERLPRIGG